MKRGTFTKKPYQQLVDEAIIKLFDRDEQQALKRSKLPLGSTKAKKIDKVHYAPKKQLFRRNKRAVRI
jgi:hypothetical protein